MGSIHVLQLLFSNESDRTAKRMYNPFVDAIRTLQFESAAFLVGLRFDTNKGCRYGIPALHHAAFAGNLPGVKWLLRQGADKSQQAVATGDPCRFKTPGPVGTAEDVARSRGHTEVAEYLASFVDSPYAELLKEDGS